MSVIAGTCWRRTTGDVMAGDRLRLRLDGRIELVHKVSPGGRVLCDVFRQYSLARVLELEASGLLYRVPDCDGVRK